MTTQKMPFVSIIVPVLNGERTIRQCLVSLLRVDYPPERREILIVDNGSSDGTIKIVKQYPVELLTESRKGAAAARNRGIDGSRGEILAFTDADCVISTCWLRELANGFNNATVSGVEGETPAYPSETPTERYAARIGSHSRQARLSSPFFPFVNTANVAFRREVFERIGCFDTRFPGAGFEDIDFSWRFFQAGNLELRYNPKAIVFHHHRSTAWGFFRQQMGYGHGLAILRAKYSERLPWGWRQEIRAWVRVAGFAWGAAAAAFRCEFRGGQSIDVSHAYFTFVRKFALRLGFLRGTLAWLHR